MRISIVTPPAPIVTVAEVKQWTRIDAPDDDDMLERMIASATRWLDAPSGWVGRSFGVQTLQMTFGADVWRCRRLPLWYPPIREVVSVHYYDAAGVEQELAPASWRMVGEAMAPTIGSAWPDVECRPDAARVVYEAGYDEVPDPIRFAIMMLVAQGYKQREAASSDPMSEPPFAVSALVSPFRVLRV